MPDDRRAELRERLTPEQYAVTQEGATERPFTGRYADHHEDGTYRCVVCGEPLFDAATRFESGTGWPSFYEPAADEAVEDRPDTSHGTILAAASVVQGTTPSQKEGRWPPRSRSQTTSGVRS